MKEIWECPEEFGEASLCLGQPSGMEVHPSQSLNRGDNNQPRQRCVRLNFCQETLLSEQEESVLISLPASHALESQEMSDA